MQAGGVDELHVDAVEVATDETDPENGVRGGNFKTE
jgi:hypothetical protein